MPSSILSSESSKSNSIGSSLAKGSTGVESLSVKAEYPNGVSAPAADPLSFIEGGLMNGVLSPPTQSFTGAHSSFSLVAFLCRFNVSSLLPLDFETAYFHCHPWPRLMSCHFQFLALATGGVFNYCPPATYVTSLYNTECPTQGFWSVTSSPSIALSSVFFLFPNSMTLTVLFIAFHHLFDDWCFS